MITVPVTDKNGIVVLYDIYIDDVWHGSQRTIEQCTQYYRNWLNR